MTPYRVPATKEEKIKYRKLTADSNDVILQFVALYKKTKYWIL